MKSSPMVVDGCMCTTADKIILIGSNSATTDDLVYTPYPNYNVEYNNINMWSSNTLHGNYNIMVGCNTGFNPTIGNYNYYIGWDAGYSQKTKEELKRESRKNKIKEIFEDDI